MSFVSELKRRNVFKVGAAYAIVGWLLVQIADTLFPRLQLPEWTVTFVAALIILGFPVALLLSWAFELTPDGIKQTRNVPMASSVRHVTGQQLNYVVTALVVVALGFLFFDRYAGDGATSARREGVLPNSIAVLPFANLSPNADDAYFAAGIHEEILNQLAKIRDINVIARNSVLRYADGPQPITEIAAELNVETIMEGSVRYAEGRVLVTAQLIDPATNAHLWSESYNRAFSDIFFIQADIATSIAMALEAQLTGAERESIEKLPTSSPEAYALYLRARERQRGGSAEYTDLAWSDDLDRAIALDPDFALAYALKANLYRLNFGLASENWQEIVRENAERALEIDPTIGLAYRALGGLYQLTWRWEDAERAFSRAAELTPNDSAVLLSFAELRRDRGQFEDVLELMRRAVELRPNGNGVRHQLGVSYRQIGNFQAAADAERIVVERVPEGINGHIGLAMAEAMLGNRESALEELRIAEQLGAGFATFRLAQMILAYSWIDRPDDAARLMSDLETAAANAEPGYGDPALALASLALGDYDRAYMHLERAIEQQSSERISLGEIKANYWNDPVLEEPRFQALRDRIGSN